MYALSKLFPCLDVVDISPRPQSNASLPRKYEILSSDSSCFVEDTQNYKLIVFSQGLSGPQTAQTISIFFKMVTEQNFLSEEDLVKRLCEFYESADASVCRMDPWMRNQKRTIYVIDKDHGRLYLLRPEYLFGLESGIFKKSLLRSATTLSQGDKVSLTKGCAIHCE